MYVLHCYLVLLFCPNISKYNISYSSLQTQCLYFQRRNCLRAKSYVTHREAVAQICHRKAKMQPVGHQLFISLNRTSELAEDGINISSSPPQPPLPTAVESNIYHFFNVLLESSMFIFMHTQSISPENCISPLRL